MRRRRPLRQQMLLWLFSFLGLMTVAVFAAAYYLHERAEHLVWRALLTSEMDSVQHRLVQDPHYHWQDSDTLSLYRADAPGGLPAELAGLAPGLHDGVSLGGRPSAVLVREVGGQRWAMALGITDFEALEHFVMRWSVVAGVLLLVLTLAMASLGMHRLVRPLVRLAGDIGRLRPDRPGQRLQADPCGSTELEVVAAAFNGFLARNEAFVEREQGFVGSVSHELRTPVAVIAGASELALAQPGLSPVAREQIARIQATARTMDELVALLLLLARDPSRVAAVSEPVDLMAVARRVVADHQYLLQDKALTVNVHGPAHCWVLAPRVMAQAAVGNLLRNAIENSEAGQIDVRVGAAAVVTVDDPGHGLQPEQIARLYTRMARSGEERHAGSGIGLNLIARLCRHLGWRLELAPRSQGAGTRATLAFTSGEDDEEETL